MLQRLICIPGSALGKAVLRQVPGCSERCACASPPGSGISGGACLVGPWTPLLHPINNAAYHGALTVGRRCTEGWNSTVFSGMFVVKMHYTLVSVDTFGELLSSSSRSSRKKLALHRWDLVKPRLPAALAWLESHVYTLAEPAPGSAVSTPLPLCSVGGLLFASLLTTSLNS